MRVANDRGRAVLVGADGTAVDVATVSGGRFGPEPQTLFGDWSGFAAWARGVEVRGGEPVSEPALGPPVPRPAQVFAIGINYTEHAAEAGYPPDALPVTFTKFPACLAGPTVQVALPTPTVDWEVELVVAVSVRAERVRREDAWDHVAGLMVGQDLSERTGQLAGAKPQFSLAKSYPGFGPTGPWLTTPDELASRDDLAIRCAVNGVVMQDSRTSRMIYDIPELVARLSSVCPLLPGDLIFTGTPAGVGNARTPRVFLQAGDVLESEIEGLGRLRQSFTAGAR